MARQSFQFGKRQREIAKKQKKEEKKLRKAERLAGGLGEETSEPEAGPETPEDQVAPPASQSSS